MAERTARGRRTRHNQVVSALTDVRENLVAHKTVTDTDLDEDTQLFETLFLREQVPAKLRTRSKETPDVFLQLHQIGVDRRRLRHHVKQRYGRADGGSEFAGQFHGGVDV